MLSKNSRSTRWMATVVSHSFDKKAVTLPTSQFWTTGICNKKYRETIKIMRANTKFSSRRHTALKAAQNLHPACCFVFVFCAGLFVIYDSGVRNIVLERFNREKVLQKTII